MNIYNVLRPLVFCLPPEWAHLVTLRLLNLWGKLPHKLECLPKIYYRGIGFPNRLGLAAGFDKDGIALQGLSRLNFGFIELGAVTPYPQPGNLKPRLFRITSEAALINRLGFNNDGVDALAEKIVSSSLIRPVPIGVNIGKNRTTPLENSVEDYLFCFDRLVGLVDFMTINISSPNTLDLRELQMIENIKPLLDALVKSREEHSTNSNNKSLIFVKISPDLDESALQSLSQVILDSGCDGVIATNTTTERHTIQDKRRGETGGLSGRPLFHRSLEVVQSVKSVVKDQCLLIGCGGIWDAASAQSMIVAGADLVQIYSVLVYRGLSVIPEILNGIK